MPGRFAASGSLIQRGVAHGKKSGFLAPGTRGFFGIIGTASYIVAIMAPVSATMGFILATIWPMTAILFAFCFYDYIALTRQSLSNQWAFLFTVIAFVLAYIMLSIQIGIRTGLGNAVAKAVGR
jgi:hypothetical protein